jgi:S1-C subfamily serine protease
MQRFFFGCLLLVLAGLSTAANAEKRIALLVGNAGYAPAVGPLKNPHNDIALLEAALKDVGFEVMTAKDAGRRAILSAVNRFATTLNAAGSDALGFFYYSGHGLARAEDHSNYLIPTDVTDTEGSDFWFDTVPLDTVIGMLENGAPNAAKFVVFDACRNELRLPTRTTLKGFVPVREKNGVFIAFSTEPNASASDRGTASGPYAKLLAEELTRPGQDHLTLFQNVKEGVFRATEQRQVPWESNGLLKRIFFAGKSQAVASGDKSGVKPVQEMLAQVRAAVVTVKTRGRVKASEESRRAMEAKGFPASDYVLQTSQGSGFFISPDGLLITPHHVIDKADAIMVKPLEGSEMAAQVVALDVDSDIALLRVQTSQTFPVLEFAGTPPQIGEQVFIVSNPLGYASSVATGIISGLDREVSRHTAGYVQIDAPVQAGSSGGAVVNHSGEVIAIVSGRAGDLKITFAYPGWLAARVAAELKTKGRFVRAWLGVSVQDVTEAIAESLQLKSSAGALIAGTDKRGPAHAAGLTEGDVVLSINNVAITGSRDLSRAVAELPPDSTAAIKVWRGGQERTLQVKLSNTDAKPATTESPDAKPLRIDIPNLRGGPLSKEPAEKTNEPAPKTSATAPAVEVAPPAPASGAPATETTAAPQTKTPLKRAKNAPSAKKSDWPNSVWKN